MKSSIAPPPKEDTTNCQSATVNWKGVVHNFQKIAETIGLPHYISVRPGDIFHRLVRKLSEETPASRFAIYQDMRSMPRFSWKSLRAYLLDRHGPAALSAVHHCRPKNAKRKVLNASCFSQTPQSHTSKQNGRTTTLR